MARQWRLIPVAAMLLAVFWGCKEDSTARDAGKPRAQAAVVVTCAAATTRRVQRGIEVSGSLYGDEEATISAKVAGRVISILRDVGDRVGPGDPLAQIDPADYRLAREQKLLAMRESLARLGLDALPGDSFEPETVPTVVRARRAALNTAARLERGRQLFQQNPPLISEQDFSDLQTAHDVAKAETDVAVLGARATLAEARSAKAALDLADQLLSDTVVRAPGAAPATASSRPASPSSQPLVPSSQRAASSQLAAPSSQPRAPSSRPAVSSSQPAAPSSRLAVSSSQPAAPSSQPAGRYAVAARRVSAGEYVREGTALFDVVADDPIKFRGAIPERYIAELRVRQTVTLGLDAFPARVFTGEIRRINPRIDPASRTFEIEAIVPNPDGALRPGAFARAFVMTRIDPGVTFVPATALVTFAGVKKVFINDHAVAREARVQTGERDGDWIEIVSGLEGTPIVVVANADDLSNGTPLRIEPAPPATSPATNR